MVFKFIKKFFLGLVAILTFTITIIHANQYENKIQFRHITMQDGLSTFRIHCILQDSRGFMWFGTQDGLNRYNGYEFKVYHHDNSGKSIRGEIIKTICEDRQGYLWVGTSAGLSIYNYDYDNFDPPEYLQKYTEYFKDLVIHKILLDEANNVWVSVLDSGLYQIDLDKASIEHFTHNNDPESLGSNTVNDILEDSHGNLWLATEAGLNLYNPEKESFRHFKHDPNDPQSISGNSVWSITEDNNDNICVGVYGEGICLLDLSNLNDPSFKRFQHQPDEKNSLLGNAVQKVLADSKGGIWIGIENVGLSYLKKGYKKFVNYKHNPLDPSSLTNNAFSSLYEDNVNDIWIGTYLGGVNVIHYSKNIFQHYKHIPGNQNTLSHNTVNVFYQDSDGMIWVGTNGGGLNKFNMATGNFTSYTSQNSALSNNVVTGLCEDKDGFLWIGTWGGGINIFDRKEEKFVEYYSQNNSNLKTNRIHKIVEDNKGRMLVIIRGGGLTRYNHRKKKFEDVTDKLPDKFALLSLCVDNKNNIIMGTTEGLWLYDKDKNSIRKYENDPDDDTSISNNTINNIHESNDSTLWIGTSYGLNKFNKNTKKFTRYLTEDGLPNNCINTILEDDSNNLWLSTNQGFSKFNPQTETFHNYTVEAGWRGNPFKRFSALKSESGLIFFGGINGFNVIDPDKIKINSYIPPIVLTNFQIFNQDVPIDTPEAPLDKHITEAQNISLDYNQNSFSFTFAALNYISSHKNKYKYILEGFDNDWNKVGTRRRAHYTNVPPGEYIFKAKGSNNNGVWNEKPASIKVIISPPWWGTLQFRILAIIVALSAIITLYKMRVNSIKERRRYITNIIDSISSILITVDPQGKVTQWNKQAVKLTGKTPEQVLGKSLDKVFPRLADDMGLIFKTIQNKELQSIAKRPYSMNGSTRYEDVMIYPLIASNAQGAVIRVDDVTKTHQVQEALKNSEAKYYNLIEHSNDAIYLLYHNKFEIVNEKFEKLFGISQEEASSKEFNFMDLVAPKSHALVKNRRKQLQAGKKPGHRYEFTALDKDGKEIEVEVSVSYIDYKDGIATQGILRNITKRKAIQKKLQQSQKLQSIGTLAGGVAHDFNNILTVIIGTSQMALSELDRSDQQYNDIKNIYDSAQRAARLTEQLLIFSRKKEFDLKVINVNRTIIRLEKMLNRLIGEDIHMTNNFAEKIWNIKADENQIEQVVTNLVVNARDAMPEGGSLIITTRNIVINKELGQNIPESYPGQYVCLEVADSGEGIDKKHQDKIFDPFFTTKGRSEGTGMGLSVVHGIVKKHNGFINVYSEPGEGAVFKVYIPALQDCETEEEKQKNNKKSDNYQGDGESILVVEDEEVVLDFLKNVLSTYNYNLYTANCGEEAIRIFEENKDKIDLLLSDVVMTGINGKKLADKLNKRKESLSVILSSGYPDKKVEPNEIRDKGYRFIQKPYQPAELLELIYNTLQGEEKKCNKDGN